MRPTILSGTFAVGWSDVLCQLNPLIIGPHPESPDDPFALLMRRIRAVESNPSCIITTTFVDTVDDTQVQSVVDNLAESLLPRQEWTQVVLHADPNEFFDRCVRHHGYTKTFHELQQYRLLPEYLQRDVTDVQHVHVPLHLVDTPDMLRDLLRKALDT